VVKKSAAISPSQCAFKNWRQVVFLLRSGAGEWPFLLRMLSTVESLILIVQVGQSPHNPVTTPARFSLISFKTSFSNSVR